MDNLLNLRASAAEATVKEFDQRPFVWGETDCAMVVLQHFKNLGHETRFLRGVTPWSTEKGALRALLALGVRDLATAMDNTGFERIAPTRLLNGDVVGLPGEDPWTIALGVYVGNQRALSPALGFMMVGNLPMEWTKPEGEKVPTLAWRVDPCLK